MDTKQRKNLLKLYMLVWVSHAWMLVGILILRDLGMFIKYLY
jgi:hypothetical protein